MSDDVVAKTPPRSSDTEGLRAFRACQRIPPARAGTRPTRAEYAMAWGIGWGRLCHSCSRMRRFQQHRVASSQYPPHRDEPTFGVRISRDEAQRISLGSESCGGCRAEAPTERLVRAPLVGGNHPAFNIISAARRMMVPRLAWPRSSAGRKSVTSDGPISACQQYCLSR